MEYTTDIQTCNHCQKPTITTEEHRKYLLEKAEELKRDRARREKKKTKWEKWKKTEAMLYRKTSINYKKWEVFEDEEEEEEELPFVPPVNDPNYAALEKDIEERSSRRKKAKQEATVLKEQGNEFMAQGKYRIAI